MSTLSGFSFAHVDGVDKSPHGYSLTTKLYDESHSCSITPTVVIYPIDSRKLSAMWAIGESDRNAPEDIRGARNNEKLNPGKIEHRVNTFDDIIMQCCQNRTDAQ